MDEIVLRYRGQAVTGSQVDGMRRLIAEQPDLSRRQLSYQVCEAFNWRQANGALRDMVCRGVMLALHRDGRLTLPAVKKRPCNPLAKRERPERVEIDKSRVEASLAELGPLEFRQVRRTSDESLFNSLLQQEHYLGYSQPVGEHLKFMVYAGERPVALFGWSSAPRHLAPRDLYVGWGQLQRRKNIHFVAYNTRYLILPWMRVPHLASHLLSRMTRMLSGEWEKFYGHAVYLAETFVDPSRFSGTCYRAANWIFLGRTTGRGKADQTHRPNRSLKDVWGLPLVEDFRARLHAA